MNFRIGQKVVCVDASGIQGVRKSPKEGEVYTVRWVGLHHYLPNHINYGKPANLCICVDEFSRDHPDPNFEQDMPMRITRFRPVAEKKTDISIFTEMLKPKQRERVSP